MTVRLVIHDGNARPDPDHDFIGLPHGAAAALRKKGVGQAAVGITKFGHMTGPATVVFLYSAVTTPGGPRTTEAMPPAPAVLSAPDRKSGQ